jgi:hypothetical protein
MSYSFDDKYMKGCYNYMLNKFDKSNDLAVTFIKDRKDFMLLNKEEMNEQMKIWRQQAKNGLIVINDCNDFKLRDEDEKKWYVFVVQNRDETKSCGIDPFGIYILGILVDGYVYAFKSKTNRDNIRNYVMKDIIVDK